MPSTPDVNVHVHVHIDGPGGELSRKLDRVLAALANLTTLETETMATAQEALDAVEAADTVEESVLTLLAANTAQLEEAIAQLKANSIDTTVLDQVVADQKNIAQEAADAVAANTIADPTTPTDEPGTGGDTGGGTTPTP